MRNRGPARPRQLRRPTLPAGRLPFRRRHQRRGGDEWARPCAPSGTCGRVSVRHIGQRRQLLKKKKRDEAYVAVLGRELLADDGVLLVLLLFGVGDEGDDGLGDHLVVLGVADRGGVCLVDELLDLGVLLWMCNVVR